MSTFSKEFFFLDSFIGSIKCTNSTEKFYLKLTVNTSKYELWG
jgi:hypothetical protein